VSKILEAVRYDVYQNDQFIGSFDNIGNLELTVSGLSPNMTYTYKVLAIGSSNEILAESEEVSVITDPEAPHYPTVPPPPDVDYTIVDCFASQSQIWTGETTQITVVIKNGGPDDAPPCKAALTWDDMLLKQDVHGLAAGQTAEIVFDLGSCSNPGTFTWWALADCDGEVVERDETNNEASVTLEVISPLSFYPSPQIVYGGAWTHESRDTIYNQFYFEVVNRYQYPQEILDRLAVRTWRLNSDGTRTSIYGILNNVTYSYLARCWTNVFSRLRSPVDFIVTLEDNIDGTVLESNVVTIEPYSYFEFGIEEDFRNGIPPYWEIGGIGDTPYLGTRATLYGGNQPLSGGSVLYIGDRNSGGYATTWAQRRLNLSGQGYQSGQLETDLCAHSLYGDEYVAVKIWDGSWHTLATYNGTSWRHFSFDLSNFDLSGEIIVRLESYMNYPERSDAAYVDNVELLLSTNQQNDAPVIFEDDFENGLDNWQLNIGASGSVPLVRIDDSPYGVFPRSGNNVLYLGDGSSGYFATATADLELNLAGEAQVTLKYSWATYRLETASDYVALDIYDGQWHYDVERLQVNTGAPVWIPVTVDLSSYNLIDGFIIRFRGCMNYTEPSDAAYIDDVKITAE
jgi:hypothetical protein